MEAGRVGEVAGRGNLPQILAHLPRPQLSNKILKKDYE